MNYNLHDDGFEIVSSVLTHAEIDELRAVLSDLDIAPGHRNLMRRVPAVRALAESEKISALLADCLVSKCFPVRSIFFDKAPGANWLVPWHQDLSIAVKEKRDAPGFGPWSVKDGVPHVQPPLPVLESMVTLRLHLDDCDETNGTLRVIPGSHRHGRLSAAQIAEMRGRAAEVLCAARAGDALLMRPLLLHASAEAREASHRRVMHLEYAASPLTHGLEWAERCPSSD
jgi:ectoine hydroxylase-related dioxygenase (phytanoyl-CoA dioxygenase family)